MYKIGLGQDSHRFSQDKNKKLVLGGVEIRPDNGFEANSDGDIIIHSLCNALSSAIGGDSIGTWSDKMFQKERITDSVKFLEKIFTRLSHLWKIENVSISLEMKNPRLSGDQIMKIKRNLGKLLEVETGCVGMTITSGEELTSFGQGLAAQALTIVLLKHD